MQRILVVWVEPPHGLQGVEAEGDESVTDRDTFEPTPESNFPGPTGRYRRLAEEVWRTMEPDDPKPIFLHESHEAYLEKWVNSLPDAAAEVAIVARVRNAVMQLVETQLAADPEALSASPTVTTTEPTRGGIAVVGRGVVLRPARRLHQAAPPGAERQIPLKPPSWRSTD